MKDRHIFRAECAKLCNMDPKTWDKYVKKEMVPIAGTTPPNKKYHWLSDVLAFRKKILKRRMKGLPLIVTAAKKKAR